MEHTRNKVLIAVSGGPDSMLLLHWAIEKYGRSNLVVASVNYKTRVESDSEIEFVKNFCSHKNIVFETRVCDRSSSKGNFENWAREQRYLFFKELYDKYSCKILLTGHHKDDFIETALMQKESGRNPMFFGIKSTNILFDMFVYRPFIDLYYKSEIISKLNQLNIDYCLDKTNFIPVYTRNKIRQKLSTLSTREKEKIYNEFVLINANKDWKKIKNVYKIWANTEYSQDCFVDLGFKEQLIYKFVHENFQNINLSSSKIHSIIQWYCSANRTSKYLIKDSVWLVKKRGKLIYNLILNRKGNDER
ncbi:tRNA lysidine(34) synthetase TilS [Mycoplasma simbae]|uniref:tRNA lysidine(34) synthetase TilS n=1 Tax=Mycoplasma simbae TaxID=36744 RepID=UPI00068C4CEE|nr:tRNA lysidine(34) synthetase TilS [Mycoplasma simbae]